jgi:hypothetical protein
MNPLGFNGRLNTISIKPKLLHQQNLITMIDKFVRQA